MNIEFQGLTKSLVDIPSTSEGISEPSQKEISAAVGYVLGFLLGNTIVYSHTQRIIWVPTPIQKYLTNTWLFINELVPDEFRLKICPELGSKHYEMNKYDKFSTRRDTYDEFWFI